MGRARLTATGASVKILQTHLRQLTHTIMVIQRKPGGNPEVKTASMNNKNLLIPNNIFRKYMNIFERAIGWKKCS